MKKTKFLICLLIMSLLVGCGNGDGSNNAPEPTAVVDTTENNAVVTDAPVKDDNTQIPEPTSVPMTDEINGVDDKKDADDSNTVAVQIETPGDKKTAVAGDIKGSKKVETLANKSGISGYDVIDIEFKKKDTDVSLKDGEIKTITFSEDSAVLDCPGAKVANVDGRVVVTIMQKGSYVLTGTCGNGQVVIDSDKEENVHIYLNGLDLNCNGSAAIYEKNCDKLIVTLVKGSINNVSETGELNFENPEKEEPDAAIFTKDKTVINGDGEINVFSSACQGIASTDDVFVISGNINIVAASHGIKGKDRLVVNSGNINISAGKDGVKSSSSKDGKGYIVVLGGNMNITSSQDGIQAEGEIQLTGGNINIVSGGGESASSNPELSCKGVKAGRDIYVNGCNLNISSSENTLKSEGNVIIDAGKIDLKSGKKCISGAEIMVNGGEVSTTDKQ